MFPSHDRKESGMSSGFMDRQQTHEALYDYTVSKEWWMFMRIFHNSGADDTLIKIENTYYPPKTQANADFHLIMYPPFGTISLAKKSRMNENQLSEMLGKKAWAERDIILLSTPNGPTEIEEAFYHEVMQGITTVRQIREEDGV